MQKLVSPCSKHNNKLGLIEYLVQASRKIRRPRFSFPSQIDDISLFVHYLFANCCVFWFCVDCIFYILLYFFFFLNSLITMDVTASRFGFWFFFVDKRGVNRCCYVAETEIFATFVLMAEILTRQSLNIFHSICIRSLCFHNLQFTLF